MDSGAGEKLGKALQQKKKGCLACTSELRLWRRDSVKGLDSVGNGDQVGSKLHHAIGLGL